MTTLNRNNSNWSFEERRKINENWSILEGLANSTASGNNGLKSEVDQLKITVGQNTNRITNSLQLSNQANVKSDNAILTANEANSKAENAILRANKANEKSDDAVLTANTVNSKADNAVSKANEANFKSDNAVLKANEANEKSDYVQSQLDSVIADGDSSAEVVQARKGKTNLRERLDDEYDEVTSQLDEKIDNYKFANAKVPLNIKTYDGSNQATHPSVTKIPRTLTASGARYVQAYTPYPNSNDDYENPSIAWSFNGEDWFNFGATNPIDKPTAEETANGAYMSDTEILFNATLNRLELYYRFNDENNGNLEYLYRKTSTNGSTWSARELVLDKNTFGHGLLSPTIHFDGTKYIMWAVAYTNKIYRYESTTALAGSWVLIGEVTLNYASSVPSGYRTWHMHVLFDTRLNKYIFTLNSLAPNSDYERHLLLGLSSDGNVVDDINIIMLPNLDAYAFDGYYLYRASLARSDSGLFYLYYGAYTGSTWAIGLSKSIDIDNPYLFIGFDYRTNAGTIKQNRVQIETIETLSGTKLSDEELLFRGTNKAAKIKNTSNNELQVQNENGALANFTAAKLTTGEALAFFVAGIKSGQILLKDSLQMDIRNESDTDFLRLRAKDLVAFRHVISNGSDARLSLANEGVSAVDFKLSTSANIVDVVVGGSNNNYASQKVNSVILTGAGVAVEGAIRYNASTKKHQGYNGTTWNDLY